MITRDYLLRQIQQAAQVLAQVLFHKNAREYDEAQDVLTNGLRDLTGWSVEALRNATPEALRSLCETGGAFSAEKAIILADLLREDASEEGRKRALWLYEAVVAAGQTVPIDVHDRIRALRDSLQL